MNGKMDGLPSRIGASSRHIRQRSSTQTRYDQKRQGLSPGDADERQLFILWAKKKEVINVEVCAFLWHSNKDY